MVFAHAERNKKKTWDIMPGGYDIPCRQSIGHEINRVLYWVHQIPGGIPMTITKKLTNWLSSPDCWFTSTASCIRLTNRVRAGEKLVGGEGGE